MTRTKRALVIVGLLGVAAAAVIGLMEATQDRPEEDITDPDSASIIVFTVEAREFPEAGEPGATLWLACQVTIDNEVLQLGEIGDGTYRVDVQPALGENGERRLVGCLEDVTVARLAGEVVSIDHVDNTDDLPIEPVAEQVEIIPDEGDGD